MALATYSDLRTSVANWMRRTDLTDQIPDFITMAEAQMRRAIRDNNQVVRATATIADGYSTTPADFRGVESFTLDTDPPVDLKFLSNGQMTAKAQEFRAPGRPRFFSIVGPEFRFLPAPDTGYQAELAYYQDLPALSDTSPTNWMLEQNSDAYLYGALAQASIYVKNDARLATFVPIFTAILEGIAAQNDRVSYGQPLTMRARPIG